MFRDTQVFLFFLNYLGLQADMERGFVIHQSPTRGYYAEGNDERIRVTVRYPFRSEKFDKYEFKKLEDCYSVIKLFNGETLQNTIDEFFNKGVVLLKKQLSIKRVKKQAALIGLGSIFTAFIYEKTISVFNKNNVEVTTDEHLKNEIREMLCSITFNSDMNRIIQDENKAKVLVDSYFDNVKADVDILQGGRIRDSNLEKLFVNYCIQINDIQSCKAIIEYGDDISKMIDYGFMDIEFVIHVMLKIPRLLPAKGVFHDIDTFFIPVRDSLFYKKPVLQSFVELDSRNFYEKDCKGSYETYFLCKNNFYEISILNAEFKLNYIVTTSEFPCITETLQEKFYVANKVQTTISFSKNSTVVTKILNPGIHIYETQNALITCENTNFKIFDNTVINAELKVKNFTRRHQDVTEPQLSFTEFSKVSDTTWSTSVTSIIMVLLIVQMMLNIMVIKKLFYKSNTIDQETLSIKSIG